MFRYKNIVEKIILLFGILLPLIQFLFNRSLWLDESFLALNIIHKSPFELFKPLIYAQVAPVIFLQFEKLISSLIPNSEYGLRLFPLFCYWGALYCFYKLIKILFKNEYSIIFALSLFVFDSTLIYYSSEVKQYISEVFVTTLMLFLTFKDYKNNRTKLWTLGLVGATGIFLSNVSPIILSTIGLIFLYDLFFNKTVKINFLIGISLIWGITYTIFYIIFVYEHPSHNFMIKFWSQANAFMPLNPFKPEFYLFIYDKIAMIFNYLLCFGKTGIGLFIIYILGCAALIIRKKYNILILLILPVLIHLLLSSFQLYPFHQRLVLYYTPLLIIMITFGIDYSINLFKKDFEIKQFRILLIIIPLFFGGILFSNGMPIKNSEIKESINFIKNNIKEKEYIYVYYSSVKPVRYYTDIKYFNFTNNVLFGKKSQNKNLEDYFNEILNLNGKYWLLFSNMPLNEEEYIIKRLKILNKPQLSSYKTKGSSAYLYDLTY